jgi:hypothetical protein
VRTPWKSFRALLVIGLSLSGVVLAGSVQNKAGRQVTLNGVVMTLPQGYEWVTGNSPDDSVLLYDGKHREGMVVAVPAVSFVEQDVLKTLRHDCQFTFFLKKKAETQPYQWKVSDTLRKVSKFEVGDGLAKGFNNFSLLVFEYRHIVFNEKDVFVGTMFEARRGKPAEAMFNGEETAMSMTTCGAAAELIYSFTDEKIDPDRPPCELTANLP